jgi:hypoxanthine phosphoribosyltransferase
VTAAALPPAHPAFAHASEAELARILDFYQVRWRYEPDTYPIGWNLDGEVVESFSPDFYLPDMELYVELTTLKQKLVRKKNRKLRRLRELYPDIRIKLFYARDFRMLMLKFGRMALIEDLTGTTGQSTPPRLHGPAKTPRDLLPGPAGPSPTVDPGPPAPDAPALDASADDDEVGVLLAAAAGSARRRRRGRRRRRTSEAVTAALLGPAAVTGPDEVRA